MALVRLGQHNMWNCLAQCWASSRYLIDFLSFFLHCRGDSPASCPCSNKHSLELQFIRGPQNILLIYAPFIPLDNALGKWGACVHLIQARHKQAQLLTLPENGLYILTGDHLLPRRPWWCPFASIDDTPERYHKLNDGVWSGKNFWGFWPGFL